MAKAVSIGIESKAEAAGLPKRLAARLGAMARAGLYVSEVVFELLAEGDRATPLRNLVLTPGLVELAPSLTTDRLVTLIGAIPSAEYFKENPLKLAATGALRCIAIEDEEDGVELEPGTSPGGLAGESLASGLSARAGSAQHLPVLAADAGAMGSMLPALSVGDTQRVFGADQLAGIKLTLATSTSPDAKIEAVRKIWLSPLAEDEKAMLFLLALRDDSRAVRSEAAKGLGTLGLDPRVAENLARACSAEEPERLVAVANLEHMLGKAGEREVTLAVGVLTGLISGSEPTRLVSQALGLLRQVFPQRAQAYPDLLRDLHGRVQSLLLIQRVDTLQPSRRLYETLLEHAPTETAHLLRASLDEVAPRYLRSFYLSLLATSGTPLATDESVVAMLVTALVEGDELDPSHYALEGGIRRLGRAVLPALLADFRRVGERRRIRLISVFADLFQNAGLTGDEANAVVTEVVTAFERSGPELRRAVYESPLIGRAGIDPELQARAARMMLADVHEHELDTGREMVSGSVLGLGGPAWSAALDTVINGTRTETVEVACDLLGLLVERWSDAPEVRAGAAPAIDELVPLVDTSHHPARGPLYRAIGRVTAHASVSSARADEVREFLLERARTSSSTYDIIEGLGYLASGDSISEPARMELCHVLVGFLELDLPKLSGRTRMVAEELVLEFGRETTAYTDLIPRLLGALERVITRPNVSLALWRYIVDVLRKIFGRVARYEVVWAPASMLALARALGLAATSPHADSRLREELTELLLLKGTVTPVVQVLGRVCMTEHTPRMDALAGQVFQRLVTMLESAEDLELSERREMLRSLAALLERSQIGEDEDEDRRARRRILDHLFAGAKSRISGVGDMLRGVAAKAKLSTIEREEITNWLERAATERRR